MANGLRIMLCFFALWVTSGRAQSATGGTPQDATPPTVAYADSPKGLQDFLENLFAAIKTNDKPRTDSLWQSTLLPYAFVASLDTVKFVVLPLAQAAVNRPDSWAKLILLSMKAPVSAYKAEAIGPAGAASYMLGYFFYVGGAFRWIDEGVFSAMSVTKISTRLPYISSLEAQMLLLQSTPPVTPPLVRKEGISNTVMLDVIIDVLGQVRSASILSGDIVLGNAARAAVLMWRYRPYIQNGRPVDVETTVTVTFPL